jgi:Porphyromonas-type peptidyl-arginine deiminase
LISFGRGIVAPDVPVLLAYGESKLLAVLADCRLHAGSGDQRSRQTAAVASHPSQYLRVPKPEDDLRVIRRPNRISHPRNGYVGIGFRPNLDASRLAHGIHVAIELEHVEIARAPEILVANEGQTISSVREAGLGLAEVLIARVGGDSAKAYWGESLTLREYEYVLKLEFGADRAVDLSKLVSHVDYFVAFLARENIALVSQPLTENYDAARAALDVLVKHYDPVVPAELQQLDRLFVDRQHAFRDELGAVRKTLARAKKAVPGWPVIEDGALAYRLGQYLTKNCASSPQECLLAGPRLSNLLHADLPLARRWVTAARRGRSDQHLVPQLLSVIESQLPGFRIETQPRIDAAVAVLEGLGFRVIRVPRLGGDRSLAVPWSGISYANAVVIDDQLFVPEFGLGKFEQKFFTHLQSELPSHYTVVPVYARHMMLFNGGTHCVLAIVRQPFPTSQPAAGQ